MTEVPRRCLTQEKLDELRATISHAEPEDLGIVPSDSEELHKDLSAYCHKFAKPKNIENRPCLVCGAHLGGFTWGLVHGHGHCRECGWPATLYHFIKDRHGADLATVRGYLLQVHPDNVSIRQKPV